MLRASWTGMISFGLVSIPVRAIPAQSSRDVRFELVHRECRSRLQTQRWCPICERLVEEEEIARGYRAGKEAYVLFEPEEIENLSTPAKHTLQILDFVDMHEVDPVYYERPYYLQPGPGGERTYALLHRAMSDRGRVGIGKVALTTREHLALIRPFRHALVMETIAFPDEVRVLEEAVPPFEVAVDERELRMADLLIENLTAAFEPDQYQDEYRRVVLEHVEAKLAGGAAVPAPSRPARGEVLDLMETLRRSVEAARSERGAVPAPSPPAPSTPAPSTPGDGARGGKRRRAAEPAEAQEPATEEAAADERAPGRRAREKAA